MLGASEGTQAGDGRERRLPGVSGGEIGSAVARPAPLISIVIPVYNAGSDLASCLDSITGQSLRNIEIIAVNGGSTDGSGEFLDERAAAEPRLTVLHEDTIGPGQARNVGAGQASGRYLWFVDADDAILPGCLAAIAERLESAAPDVLLIDYQLGYAEGRIEPSPDHAALARALPTGFVLADQPWAIDLTMASWNKVIRTGFFRSSSAAFEKEWPHEDIRVTCLLLLEARKLSVLNLACYRYRKDAPGSLMTSGDVRRHFRALDVWHAVLDQVRKRAGSTDATVTKAVYIAFFERAVSHCSYLLDARLPGAGPFRSQPLVARGTRREFFERMHWDYVHYKPAEYQRPKGLRGVKFRLIERDSYRAYCVLLSLNRLRLRATNGIGRGRTGGPPW
jgi:CDP-glycerol glycerophosphotransferase